MVDYVEDPIGRIVGVHWKDDDEPPPDPTVDPDCQGGTWFYTSETETIVIHDGGVDPDVPPDRIVHSLPTEDPIRVIGSLVEFGNPTGLHPPPPYNIYGHGINTAAKVEIDIQHTLHVQSSNPGGTPMFYYDLHHNLSFSRLQGYWGGPGYPPYQFMEIGAASGSYPTASFHASYTYNMSPTYRGSYPNYNPNDGGGPGAFYFTGYGSSITWTAEYQAWHDYYYAGGGGPPPPPPPNGFDNNQVYVTEVLSVRLICGPLPQPASPLVMQVEP